MKYAVAQTFGILALVVMVLSYQQKQRRTLLRYQMVSNALFVISYYILGAFPMMAMSCVNIARSYVFSRDDTRWGAHPAWLYVFMGISVISGISTWQGSITLLVIAATLVLNIALYSKDTRVMHKLFLIPPLLYIPYNLMSRSLGGIGSDVFCLTSALIAIIRFDRKETNKS